MTKYDLSDPNLRQCFRPSNFRILNCRVLGMNCRFEGTCPDLKCQEQPNEQESFLVLFDGS